MAKAPANLRSLARSHTEAAVKVLVSVMNDPSAPQSARALAATEILNRGYGALIDPQRFVPDRREYYVYSIHADQGDLLYIGKGVGRRSLKSAQRLKGKSRIRAMFTSEKQALAFEKRLILKFRPPANMVHNLQALSS